jgi:hypothetical protein
MSKLPPFRKRRSPKNYTFFNLKKLYLHILNKTITMTKKIKPLNPETISPTIPPTPPVSPIKEGREYKRYGTREEVYAGICELTRGKLTKADLFEDPKTKTIKSRHASLKAKDVRVRLAQAKQTPTPPRVKEMAQKYDKAVTQSTPSRRGDFAKNHI